MKDIDMMKHEDEWPLWPLLPVKKYPQPGCAPIVGVLAAGQGPKVYLIGILDVKTGLLGDVLDGVPTKDFNSFEHLVAEGWMVD